MYPWDDDGRLPLSRLGTPLFNAQCPPCPNLCAEMFFSPVDAKWHCRCGVAEKQGEYLVYTEAQPA